MAETQILTQAITQAATKAAKVVVNTMSEATEAEEGTLQRNAVSKMRPKAGGPSLKQPKFEWSVKYNYIN